MYTGNFLLSLIAVGAAVTPLVAGAVVTEYRVHTEIATATVGPGGYGGSSPRPHHHHHHKPQPSGYTSPDQPSPEPSGSPNPQTGYPGLVISHHNVHRANHSAPDIQWDQGLADTAAKIAQTCVYGHNVSVDGGGYGQNIAAGIGPDDVGTVITNIFYNNEVSAYPSYGVEPDMSGFSQWGHFSQVVWKGTKYVGCATSDCSEHGLQQVRPDVAPYFTVCNYLEPGNYGGQYAENVLQPLGQPSVGPSL